MCVETLIVVSRGGRRGCRLSMKTDGPSVECREAHERFEPQEDVVFRSQLMGKIEDAMDELSASSQEILRLKIRDGLTYDELGAQLGIAAGTVKSRIFEPEANSVSGLIFVDR